MGIGFEQRMVMGWHRSAGGSPQEGFRGEVAESGGEGKAESCSRVTDPETARTW